MTLKRLKHKYGAKRTTHNGVRYDSKAEAAYAARLDIAQKAGSLLFYLRQVPIALPGSTTYRVDFVEFWAPKGEDAGEVVFTDVKGMETEVFKLKKRQVEELYPIEINVVKK